MLIYDSAQLNFLFLKFCSDFWIFFIYFFDCGKKTNMNQLPTAHLALDTASHAQLNQN